MQYEQEGMKKRGKNVYRESSEYHANTGDSISRQVFAAFTSSLVIYGKGRFVYISVFFKINGR